MQIRLQSCTYEPGENSMYIHVYTIICVGQFYGAISKRAMAHSKRDEFNQRNRACIIRSSLQFGVQLEVEFSATSLLLSALLLLAHCTSRPLNLSAGRLGPRDNAPRQRLCCSARESRRGGRGSFLPVLALAPSLQYISFRCFPLFPGCPQDFILVSRFFFGSKQNQRNARLKA